MKKLFFLIAFLVTVFLGFAQHPIGNDSFALQTTGSSNTFFKSKGAIGSDSGLVVAKFPDTTSANRSKLSHYPGAVMRTGNILWLRDSTATHWIIPGYSISTVNIVDSSHIQICDINGCTTIEITGVTAQLVTVINDTTLRVCDTLGACVDVAIARTQFIQMLFDTTNIYQTIQNLNIYTDSLLDTKMDKRNGVDTFYRINDSVTAHLYFNDSLRLDTTHGFINANNIYQFVDTTKDTLQFNNPPLSQGQNFVTVNNFSDRPNYSEVQFYFPHNNPSEDSVLTTDEDGNLKMVLKGGGLSSVAWGDITGTLSDQTDLQSALDAKQDNLTLTTTGSSGAATLIGSTLNIPQYSGGGGSDSTIYKTDGTITGPRTVTMNNNPLFFNGGNVGIGTGFDDGHTLRVTGTVSFNNLGGTDATGNLFYRDSLGSFVPLAPPTGLTKPVLGFTTLPTWQEDSVGSGGGGSSDSTIYKTDGTIISARTVTMNNWLSFKGANVGIGATSTSPASLLTLSRAMPVSTNIVPEDSTGAYFRTSAAATSGNSSSAPGIVFESNGWNTTAGASQSAKFKIYGSSGSASSLLGNLYIGYSSNGGAYTQPFQFVGPNGNLVITGAFVAGTTITGTTHIGTNFTATRTINNTLTNYLDNSTINYSASTPVTFRSHYFNPTVTSALGVDVRAWENTVGNVVLNSTSGSTSIGSSDTIVGAKLAITDTAGALLIPRMTKAQRNKIYSGFTGSITEDGTGGAATNNTYIRAFTGGSGTGATGSFVVVSNVVTSVTILEYGKGYVAGDVLSAVIGSITGFTWTISAVTPPKDGSFIYQTDNTPGLREMQNGAWVKYTSTPDP